VRRADLPLPVGFVWRRGWAAGQARLTGRTGDRFVWRATGWLVRLRRTGGRFGRLVGKADRLRQAGDGLDRETPDEPESVGWPRHRS